jgi:hypothetical protein
LRKKSYALLPTIVNCIVEIGRIVNPLITGEHALAILPLARLYTIFISFIDLWVPGLMILSKVKLKLDVVVPVKRFVTVTSLPETLHMTVFTTFEQF